MLKNILFDLDDTIFDFHAAERAAVSETLVHFGCVPDESVLSRYSELNKAQWERLERGEITRGEVKTERFRLLFAETGIELSPDGVAAYYETRLSREHIFIPGAKETIKRLSEKYRLYLVTNGTSEVQNRRIADSGVAACFEEIFISEAVGYDKPDPRFFDRCFSRIPSFEKNETAIVGDSLTSDILGGKNAGIKTVWFNPGGRPEGAIKPDLTVNGFSQLETLLNSL